MAHCNCPNSAEVCGPHLAGQGCWVAGALQHGSTTLGTEDCTLANSVACCKVGILQSVVLHLRAHHTACSVAICWFQQSSRTRLLKQVKVSHSTMIPASHGTPLLNGRRAPNPANPPTLPDPNHFPLTCVGKGPQRPSSCRPCPSTLPAACPAAAAH